MRIHNEGERPRGRWTPWLLAVGALTIAALAALAALVGVMQVDSILRQLEHGYRTSVGWTEVALFVVVAVVPVVSALGALWAIWQFAWGRPVGIVLRVALACGFIAAAAVTLMTLGVLLPLTGPAMAASVHVLTAARKPDPRSPDRCRWFELDLL